MSRRSMLIAGFVGFAALGVLMTIWSLQNGYYADDHFVRALFKGFPGLDGLKRATLETFSFSKGNPAENEWMRDKGIFPWWAVTSAKLSFFRPLASLTHWMDFQAWGDRATPMHAQNIAWYALLCALVFVLYAELFGYTYVAVIAAFLYAMNETNGLAVGWISSRNTVMVACASAAVLIAHHRWLSTSRDRWAVLAILTFGAGLLCGEGAISVSCYLFAYAIFLDPRAWRRRIRALVPYATLAIVYLALHRASGFGSEGSAWYTDPGSDFSGWVKMVSLNIPLLLFTELVIWPSPVLSAPAPYSLIYFILLLASLVLLLALLLPSLRASSTMRFFLLGAVLSLVPVSSVIAQPRVLTISSIGAMAVVAQFIAHWIDGRQFIRFMVAVTVLTVLVRLTDAWLRLGMWLYPIVLVILVVLFVWLLRSGQRSPECLPRRRVSKVLAATLFCLWIVAHVIVAPNSMYLQSRVHGSAGRKVDAAFSTLPNDASVHDKQLIILQGVNDFTSYYFTFMRSGDGLPVPAHTRVLSTGLHPMTLERPDANTLIVRTSDGFVAQRDASIYRSDSHPMHDGEVVNLTGMIATVTKTDASGWPMNATFSFNASLDDESLLWYTGTLIAERNPRTGRNLKVERYFPVPVPAVGETISIEELLQRSDKYKSALTAAKAPR